jgi:hypothetical protein
MPRMAPCRHEADEIVFPDGTKVLLSGWFHRKDHQPEPDWGVYCDPMWKPTVTWPSVMLDWPDLGVPNDKGEADEQIISALKRAIAGERVEIACIGGHGRSGTIVACMAYLMGVPIDEVVTWLRLRYCIRAIQEPSQQYWIERFAERHQPLVAG